MAGPTTTATAASTVYAKVITSDILLELRPYNVNRPHFRMGQPGPSTVYSFPTQTKEVIADITTSITEGTTDLASSYSQLATSNSDATAAQKGVAALVSDLLVTVSIIDALPHFASVMARTMAEQYETDLAAVGATFTNISGSSTVTTNMSTLLQGRAQLATRDVVGSLVTVLHPKQVQDLQLDIGASTASFLAGENQNVNGVLASSLQGYAGAPFGIPVYQTTVVPTADAGASRAGYMFVSGVALGLYELWNIRTELHRLPNKIGTEVVLTMAYGTVKIDNARGQLIKGTS